MTQTPLRPGEPLDPELRERYLRDAQQLREYRRAESARLAAEVPPSRTPSGPIWVVAALLTLVLVVAVGLALAGPMLARTTTSEQTLPPDVSRLEIHNSIGDVRVRTAEPGEEPSISRTTEWGLRRPSISVDTGTTARVEAGCLEGFIGTCSTDWVVVVPEDTDVSIEEGAGRVVLEGLSGDVDVEAGVGDVRISDTTAERIAADLGVGSLWVESVGPPRDVDVSLGVGDLSVQLPDGVDYDVTATGGVGEVRNELGSDRSSPRQVTVEAGVGSVRLSGS